MRANFSLIASLIVSAFSFAPGAVAQTCAEAARFGELEVVPSTVAPGDSFTVHVDLTCAAQLGYLPTYMDYYIEVLTDNNGHEAPILLARRTYLLGGTGLSPADTFSAQLPYWFYFTGAQYSVVFVNSFAMNGTMNNSVITQGSISVPLNVTGI
ncbi:hypothetical protein DFH07DRAFT_878309 [Mycena maculata]|uniref:Spore coat protein U domain-containing protein n=1 Tax=Mycena maculata TaxID=230809 RepID=A0AAD7JZA1_9AGAR|nr:hypothetical protein DFH07DRAFT_878309 [Mycena maculata]